MKINFTSQIVRGVENTGMPTLGYFALLHIMRSLDDGNVKTRSKISVGTNRHYEGSGFPPISTKFEIVVCKRFQILGTSKINHLGRG